MAATYNLCIIKPNKNAFSETFIQEHINRLAGCKSVIYGGNFPVYDDRDHYIIRSKLGLLSYLFQKRILKRKSIAVRTNALAEYFKQKKIDVVFAEYGMVGAMVTAACQKAKIPLIVNFHGADIHQQKIKNEYIAWYKKTFAYAYAIVAVSNDMIKALIEAGAPKEKIYWNSCGVDTQLFKQVDLSNSKPHFLSVGRFVPKKSPQTVVKAFAIVAAQIADAHLWMVGNGPLFDETQRLVNELNLSERVTFTGVLQPAKIAELYTQMRCFVQHSVTAIDGDMEGTPVTILEAGASGLPVVSTRHAGINEAVINNKTGFLVAEHDTGAMAACMIKIATDLQLAQHLGFAGRKHITDNYDINTRIATLDSIIQHSLNNNF